MKIYQLHRKQILPIDQEQAWDFFVNPHNLSQMTPEWLHFSIRSALDQEMYEGMLIEYKITLPPSIPTTWVTEMTHVKAPHYFVDEQRLGPYRFWHHQHHLCPVKEGIEMTDIVHYAMPLGWMGQLIHYIRVSQQLKEIFDFRHDFLACHFGSGFQESSVAPNGFGSR